MNRFAVAFVAVLGLTSQATAGVEIGGSAGLHLFADDNALGETQAQTKHANSALFALRLGIGIGSLLMIEVEGGLVPTESSDEPQFDIYNAVARGQIVAQFRAADPSNKVLPFVLVGGGMIRIVDVTTMDEAQIRKETDGEVHAGIGVKYRAGGGWGVRVDFRGIGVPAFDDGKAFDFELLATLYREFGRKSAPKQDKPMENPDPDGDGVMGASDQCPKEPEDKDEFEDDNGCPEDDNDKDGIKDDTDQCKGDPEDKDNFEDDNGCPDNDNDGDGVADSADKCIDAPETKNGFEDEDGCADEIPAKLAKFTGKIEGINFKPGSADLLPASNKVLDKAVEVLAEFKDVKLEVSGHTDDVALKSKKFKDNDELSQARADSVKAYFVKKGIADDRLISKGYGAQKPLVDPAGLKGGKLNKARAQNRRVEFQLIPAGDAGEAPKAEEPKAEEKKPEEKKEEPKAEEKKEEPKKGDAKKADAKKGDEKKDEKKDEELP